MRTKDYPWDLPSKKYHQSDQGVNTSLQPLFFLSDTRKLLELARRLIHISGILTIVLSRLLGNPAVTLAVCSLTAQYLVSEYLRVNKITLPVVTSITKLAARREESSSWILSPVSYAAGILVALNVFPEPVNYAAISILTLGYGLSSLVGMRLGRHYICYNQSKTLDVLLKMPESFSSGPAENILIPVISGICMSMLFLFM